MFWRENAAWPLAHYIVPAALYVATRNLFLSLWLDWAWESVERLLATQFASFEEPWDDSLIGDPLQGSLAIVTLWLADATWQWGDTTLARVPVALRLLHFATVALASFAIDLAHTRRLRWGVLVYGALYVGTALLIYGAHADTAAWLSVVVAQTLVTAPVLSRPSVFTRVFATGLLALLCFFVAAAATPR